jgi:hypothetical protein
MTFTTKGVGMARTTHHWIFTVLSLGTGLLWTGCDSSTDPAPPSSTSTLVDACGLMTKAEAEVVFGKAVLTMDMDTIQYLTSCDYNGSIEPGRALPTFMDVKAWSTAGAQPYLGSSITAASFFATCKSTTPIAEMETVPGVGTEAYWNKKNGNLYLYKGNIYAEVSYSPLGKVFDTSSVARTGALAAGAYVSAHLP